VVSVGIIRWVECTVMEPSYFKLSTEHVPVHLALLDEIGHCHPLLHQKLLQLLIKLFEAKQDDMEILVQVNLAPIVCTQYGGWFKTEFFQINNDPSPHLST